MEELKDILTKIAELRKLLHKIIDESEKLHDDRVVAISKLLDSALNEYHKLVSEQEESK